MKTVLSIAGSDPSGGAGIQADLKTIAAHRLYGMSAITALTAQNTLGVTGVHAAPPDFFAAQLEAVLSDIPPDAVKLGMLFNEALMERTAWLLAAYHCKNIVLDPVMVSTSGHRLMEEDAIAALERRLIPLATVITPNLPEAEVLAGHPINGEDDMISAAGELSDKYRTAVLIKGGHASGHALDILCCHGGIHRFDAPRIDNPNTHGTGCTLSSAIACGLAVGKTLQMSVKDAKDYLTAALRRGLNLGHGSGPLDHVGMEWP